jgi:hypothetical protein
VTRRYRRALAFTVVVTLLAASCHASHDSILLSLHEQLRLHPAMQVDDVYKLAHQAAFGNEHLITDEVMARRYLLSELDGVKADDTEPLIERVNGIATVVRVNLGPFKARHLDPQRLVEAMLASARAFRPDVNVFERSWEDIVQSAGSGSLPWSADALRAFAAARKTEGYPAVHHSDIYNASYRPAYRVLTSVEAAKACRAD